MSLPHKYWFIPAACAIDRSAPRKTRRSKPDSTPEIWSWCFAINCCTAFLLSVEGVLFWNAPHPTRAETPQFWLRLRRAVALHGTGVRLPAAFISGGWTCLGGRPRRLGATQAGRGTR